MPFVVPYAPSSTYQPNGRLVDLLRLQGEQSADAQRRQGELQARMWGSLGQQISESVGQLAKAKEQEPINALNKLKVNEATQLAAGQQRLDSLLTPKVPNGPQPEGEGPAAPQNPYLGADGLYDVPNLTKALAASGMAHLAPELLKSAETINSSITEHQQRQQALGNANTVLYGDMAHGVLKLVQAGAPIDQALDMVAAPGLATKRFDPQQFAQIKTKLLSLPPAQQQAMLGQLMDAAAKVSPEKDLGKDAKRLDRYDRETASNVSPEKPTESTLAATASDPSKTPQERAAAQKALDALQRPAVAGHEETARHNKELERIAALTEGKGEAAQKETARHNRAMEAAANPFGGPSGGGAGGPTAQGPTGDDFLKGLQPGVAAQVKALAEGRQPFPTGMSYAKLQPLIQLVTQYDPTFDAANYTARSKARSDLTSPNGTGGKTVNSLNTAIQHLGRLSDLIEAEDNSNLPLVNSIVNPLRTAAGSTKVTNFNAVQPQAMKEIERLWRGAGGSEGDINALKDSLSKNAGKQQQREALQEFVNLVRGKLDSTEQQRDNILGAAAKDVPILFDQNKGVLDKIGQRVGGASPSEGFSAKAPNGKTYTFKSQADLDAFKKAAGL